MTRHVVLVLIGFLALLCSGLLVTTGLESLAFATTNLTAQPPAVEDSYLSHQVKAGESLYAIAKTYYGDASLWQRIARANGISSPAQLKAGQIVTIPFFADPIAPSQDLPSASKPQTPKAVEYRDPLIAVVEMRAPSLGERLEASFTQRPNCVAVTIVAQRGANNTTLYHDLFAGSGTFCYAFTADRDRDGNDELYTVWRAGNEHHVTRVLSPVGFGYSCTEVLYDDVFSLGRSWLVTTSK